MDTATPFPNAGQILERIGLCRTELAELKRALRTARALEKAAAARRARQASPLPVGEQPPSVSAAEGG